MQLASETPSLSQLVTAVKETGLVDTLNSTGPFTVFAPNNAAFDKIKDTVEELLTSGKISVLKELLLMHVIVKKINSTEIPVGVTSLETANLNKEKINVTKTDAGTVTIISSGANATVIAADNFASNGVVHIIDTVLQGNF